jgi:hypothetical protein
MEKLSAEILNGQIVFPRHFSEGAKELLTSMLQKNEMKRISIKHISQHWWINGHK